MIRQTKLFEFTDLDGLTCMVKMHEHMLLVRIWIYYTAKIKEILAHAHAVDSRHTPKNNSLLYKAPRIRTEKVAHA